MAARKMRVEVFDDYARARNRSVSFMKKSSSVVYWLGNKRLLPFDNAKRFSLYLNITNRCPNNCYFCFRKFKNGVREFNLKLRKEPSSNEVIKELQKVINRKNWSEVVFCGFGEPLERLDCILEVTRWVKKYSGKVVRVDTNGQGYLLNNGKDVVKELKNAGVDKVSVSLNAHDKATYNQVCKPEFENAFENVLEFIEKAKKRDLDTEITSVTIPEVDISKVRELAERMGVGFRVREYIPCFWWNATSFRKSFTFSCFTSVLKRSIIYHQQILLHEGMCK